MEEITDYNALDKLPKMEGRIVLVLYSNLLYRATRSQWRVIGKVDSHGDVKLRRQL